MPLSKVQLNAVNRRLGKLGVNKVRNAESEWPRLMAQVTKEMEKGTDPSSAQVQKLAKRWYQLLEMFTGGDDGIKKKLAADYKSGDACVYTGDGPSAKMIEYIAKARKA